MNTLLIILHVTVALFLVLIVLLQTGKGAAMGSAFGGASQTMFGSSGASNFLSKMTTVAAVLFMLTSLGLATFSSRQKIDSVIPESQGTEPLEKEVVNQPNKSE